VQDITAALFCQIEERFKIFKNYSNLPTKIDENDLTNDSDSIEDTPTNSDQIKRFKRSSFLSSSEDPQSNTDYSTTTTLANHKPSSIADTYTSNINKIVHELKSIGNSQETPSPIAEHDTASKKSSLEISPSRQQTKENDQSLHFLSRLLANKRKMRSLFAFKPTKLSTFISALIKQQQYLLLSNTMNDAASDRLCIDTSIISTGQNSDDLDMYAESSEMKLLKLPGIDNLVHVAPSLHSRALHKNIDLLKKSMRKLKQRDSHVTGSSNFANPLLLNEQVNQQEFNNLASPAQHQMQHLNSKPSLKHDTTLPCLPNFESVPTGYHNKAYADTHHHHQHQHNQQQHQPQSQQFFPSNSYPASSQQQHHQKTLKPPVPGYPPMNQLYNTNANHQQLYRQASTGDLTYQHYNSQHNHYQHQQHSFNNHANDKLQDYPKNASYQPGCFQAPQENLMRLQNNNMYAPPLQPQPQAHQHSQMNHHNQQQQPQHTRLAELGVNENANLANNSNETQFSGNVKPSLESNKSSYEASVSSNEKSNCVTSSNSQTFPSTLTG